MIERSSYVIYRHQDLGAIRAFLLDFGLLIADESPERIYFRGHDDSPFIYLAETGDQNEFVGLGFEATSAADLELLAKRFDAPIEDSPRPGGGRRITITDPDGKPTEIVFGAQKVAPIPTREPLAFNSGGKRNRLGRIPIYDGGPVPVLSLCHTVMASPEPERLIDWLIKELGAYPSDIIQLPDGRPLLAFLRFPKGPEFIEHHHVAVSLGGKTSAQHTCFETIDVDAVFMGHRYLAKKGYKQAWGPVRHSLGGAISDYWRDPSGFIVEHVTDGDYVNDEYKTAVSPATDELSTLQWTTQPLPADFIE